MTEETDMGGFPSWYKEIFPAGLRDGFYQKFGNHSAVFVERSKSRLVVSFDNLSEAGNPRFDREAWAGKFCADNNWSHLGVFAQTPSWFRDNLLIGFMEKLAKDGFFREFDQVAFCGTSMGGFAALTFSRLAPGSTVVAFSPQTTLAKQLVPWERRFAKGRVQDWSLSYSDAAEHTHKATKIYVIYDPFFEPDRKHFERLSGNNVIPLRGFGLGHKSALVLKRMDCLKPVMRGGIEGTLTTSEFYQLIRSRKSNYLYRMNVEGYLTERNRPEMLNKFRRAFKTLRRQQKGAAE